MLENILAFNAAMFGVLVGILTFVLGLSSFNRAAEFPDEIKHIPFILGVVIFIVGFNITAVLFFIANFLVENKLF